MTMSTTCPSSVSPRSVRGGKDRVCRRVAGVVPDAHHHWSGVSQVVGPCGPAKCPNGGARRRQTPGWAPNETQWAAGVSGRAAQRAGCAAPARVARGARRRSGRLTEDRPEDSVRLPDLLGPPPAGTVAAAGSCRRSSRYRARSASLSGGRATRRRVSRPAGVIACSRRPCESRSSPLPTGPTLAYAQVSPDQQVPAAAKLDSLPGVRPARPRRDHRQL